MLVFSAAIALLVKSVPLACGVLVSLVCNLSLVLATALEAASLAVLVLSA